ncbi:M23 family metallopeptidase [Pontibacter sp. BT327]|uniref:M23 family metallopeptidase n=2 Tax=Pontibacter burrus TaxID=2704466 RepID=A0A6B3LYL7_9BACT|nr:M23 family metallopeptidase [Pontibacter burrus]
MPFPKTNTTLYFIFFTVLVLIMTGCSKSTTLQTVFQKQTPYEAYAASLRNAKLLNTALGSKWLGASEEAMLQAQQIVLPYKETGFFAAESPRAAAYQLEAKQGEKLVINLQANTNEPTTLFVDLFSLTPDGTLKHLAFADTATNKLVFEVEEDQTYLLRLQPELLRNVQYTLAITVQPTLAFPVPGRSSRNISSVWGDPRDAGSRRHEGVDIFAPRGTPVIASSAGYISQVNTTLRGGKVVWLTDPGRRHSLYYAHLDEQLVTTGQRVEVGDTIGLVGNTGNAGTTAPHLHFGVYRYGRGAANPYHYLHQPPTKLPNVTANLAHLGEWVRIATKQANIKQLPTSKSVLKSSLPRHTPLQVLSATASWYRVALPDGTQGYIASSITQQVTKPIKQKTLAKPEQLLTEARPNAIAKESLTAGTVIAVLANYNNYSLVRNKKGDMGWLYQPES